VTSEVDTLLHSEAPLVVIEAAAGCGKTWTAAKFAQEMSAKVLKHLLRTNRRFELSLRATTLVFGFHRWSRSNHLPAARALRCSPPWDKRVGRGERPQVRKASVTTQQHVARRYQTRVYSLLQKPILARRFASHERRANFLHRLPSQGSKLGIRRAFAGLRIPHSQMAGTAGRL